MHSQLKKICNNSFATGRPRTYELGGSSSSGTSNVTSTDDNSLVVAPDGQAFQAGAGATQTISVTDGGAFDLVKASDAQAGDNYNSLLSTTGKLFGGLFDGVKTSQSLFMDGVKSSQSLLKDTIDVQQSKGTLDNKTIMIVALAVTGVIGVVLLKGKK